MCNEAESWSWYCVKMKNGPEILRYEMKSASGLTACKTIVVSVCCVIVMSGMGSRSIGSRSAGTRMRKTWVTV